MKEYYKHLCACGCGEKIEIKLWHKHSGIPKYCESGHSRRNKKNSDEHNRKISESNNGKTRSKEYKIEQSKRLKKIWEDPNSIFNSEVTKNKISKTVYKYGCDSYWHKKAYNLYGLPYCENCYMSNEEHLLEWGKRLHMHNTLDPKDYKIMESEAWMTLCRTCHSGLEAALENEKNIQN